MPGRIGLPIALMSESDKKNYSKSEVQLRQENSIDISSSQKLRMPKNLNTKAKKIWKSVIKFYKENENIIISDADIPLLVEYCECVARLDEVNSLLAEQELLVEGKANPLLKISQDLGNALTRLASHLYLSPSGRARIVAAKKDKAPSALDKLISANRRN